MLGDEPRAQLRALSWWHLATAVLAWLTMIGLSGAAVHAFFVWEPEPGVGTLAQLSQLSKETLNLVWWAIWGAGLALGYFLSLGSLLSVIALRWPSWCGFAFLVLGAFWLMGTVSGLPVGILTLWVLYRKPNRSFFRQAPLFPPVASVAAAGALVAPIVLALLLTAGWVARSTSFADAPVRAEAERIMPGAGSLEGFEGVAAVHHRLFRAAWLVDQERTLAVVLIWTSNSDLTPEAESDSTVVELPVGGRDVPAYSRTDEGGGHHFLCGFLEGQDVTVLMVSGPDGDPESYRDPLAPLRPAGLPVL